MIPPMAFPDTAMPVAMARFLAKNVETIAYVIAISAYLLLSQKLILSALLARE